MHHIPTTVFITLVCAAPLLASWKDEVGFTDLQVRLTDAIPRGAGIVLTQVEAPVDGAYAPDSGQPEFGGKTILSLSGGGAFSDHATTVGAYCYGNTRSMAPSLNTVLVFKAAHWLANGSLRTGSPLAPLVESSRVQNHSWVGGYDTDTTTIEALKRVDLVAERDGVVVVAAVNNGAAAVVPKFLASAYNNIAVGTTSGQSSYGPAPIDLPGRAKPDIVVPVGPTSYGTPIVASSAALLLDAADQMAILPELAAAERKSAKALLAKALLMAGATKDEFTDWRRGFETPSADGAVPLDYRYGAGELNIDNSYRMLEAGEQEASVIEAVDLTGWDFDRSTAGASRQYFFEIPRFSHGLSVSILTTWYRHIATSAGSPLVLTPALANIDLHLREADGLIPGELRDRSVSSIDNVEHIFLRGLGAGRYVFEVASDVDWDYAIAWDIKLAPTPPYDLDGDGDTDSDDVAAFLACSTGPAVGPPTPECAPADLDGDKDVDQADFGKLQRCLAGPDQLPPLTCAD